MATGVLRDVTSGHDDYALERVPQESRYHWATIATMRFGQISNLAMFLLGATLGFGMSFRDAFIAFVLGTAILETVALLAGIAGQREGLSTSVLTRWSGFGQAGSALVGLAIAVSSIGWFGIQSQLSAQGLHQLLGGLPEWGWSLAFGLVVTGIVVFGFRWMAWTAYLTVPALVILAGWSIVHELAEHSAADLLTAPPAGPEISIMAGSTLVAGAYIVGVTIDADMTRFNRSPQDVVKQIAVGITLGNFVIGLSGVLLAHAVGTSDIVRIVTSTSGVVGPIVIIVSVLKINDWNLYAASLGIVNFCQVVFGLRVSRALVAAVAGLAGSVLAAAGVLDHFQEFLSVLSVVFPPIIGIVAAEYYLVRAFAGRLVPGRETLRLPAGCPAVVPATLLVWTVSALIGKYVTWGLGPVNAFLAALVLYAALARLGLVRAVGGDRVRAVGGDR